jgi:hypothetical protein
MKEFKQCIEKTNELEIKEFGLIVLKNQLIIT